MRKPRDIDAELKALAERQRLLKARKVTQLGELVLATGADVLDPETLAGVLLDAIERGTKSSETREGWRLRGHAFFRRERRARADNTAPAAGTFAHDQGGAAAKPDGLL